MKIIFVFLFIALIGSASATDTWWDTSWRYSVNSNILNSQIPYQITVNLSNASGTNTATNIYCNGHCNSNFSDIRFTLDNATTLYFWLDNTTFPTKAWVNITGNGVINLYYGNTAATTSTSDITTTFLYGIDWRTKTSMPSTWSLQTNAIGNNFNSVYGLSYGQSGAGDWRKGIFYNAGTFTPPIAVETLQMQTNAGYGFANGLVTSPTTSNSIAGNGTIFEIRQSDAPTYYWGMESVISSLASAPVWYDGGNTSSLNTLYNIESQYLNGTSPNGTQIFKVNNVPIIQGTATYRTPVYIEYSGHSGTGTNTTIEVTIVRTHVNYTVSEPTFSGWSGENTIVLQPPYNLNVTMGLFWMNYTWVRGSNTELSDFSFNGSWTNKTAQTSVNVTLAPHASGLIIVMGFNTTYNKTSLAISANNTLPNNPITILNISSSYILNKSEMLNINPTFSDQDYTDEPIFSRNFTQGNFSNSTGNLTWQGEYGNFSWQICGDDEYGSISCVNFTVQVRDNIPPSQVLNFHNTTVPTDHEVSLAWDIATDNVNGSGVANYILERTNESINRLTIERPTINASGIASGYEPDAYQYTYKTNEPINCNGCHSISDRYIQTANFWMKYNGTYLYLMIHAPDNDTNSSDDRIDFTFDPNLDGGSAPQPNDQRYQLYENGSFARFTGNGTNWVSNSTGAVGAVNGPGSYAPRYEIRIPLSELGNLTNNSVIRFLLEDTCTNGGGFIERHTYYPISLTADEDNPNSWASTTFRNLTDYVSVITTSSNVTQLTGLTSSTRYNFSVKAIDNSGNLGQRSDPLIIQTTEEVGYNVTGYILNVLGQPIPAAGVIVHTQTFDNVIGIDSSGLYIFTSLLNGSYTIMAMSGIYTNTTNVTVNGSDINNVNLTITSIPADPSNLTTSCGNFYCNSTWTAGIYTTVFNLIVNGTSHNGTINNFYSNTLLSPHAWSNVSVTDVNGYTGEMSGTMSLNTQIPNNPVTLSNISSSYVIPAGQPLNIYPRYNDADNDTQAFSRNFAHGTFDNATGETHWTPTLEENGTYNFQITANDGYGSTNTISFTVLVTELEVSNLVPAKITAKTIAWTWNNPISGRYSCTELYLDEIYQACSSTAASSYLIDLNPSTSHTISLRVKDISNNFYNFTNDTETTLSSSDSPSMSPSYNLNWFAPNNGQSIPITINYNSSLVPLRNITIEMRTKDENQHVRYINSSYTYDFTTINKTKIISWNGKADNFQTVPDAYYIFQATVKDFDGNIVTITNSSGIGVDDTYPSSVMNISKSRLMQSFYYKSNYNSPDPLRVNIGYSYGDYDTSNYLTRNPITNDTTLSNLVIRKVDYISTSSGFFNFSISKDSDGKAWMWVDGIQVYNSNAGIYITTIALSAGLHEVSIEYAKGTANTAISLNPLINGAGLVYVDPISGDNLTLFGQDFNGSGVAQIVYSLNAGISYRTYTSPINISNTSINNVIVCSQDNVGNSEPCLHISGGGGSSGSGGGSSGGGGGGGGAGGTGTSNPPGSGNPPAPPCINCGSSGGSGGGGVGGGDGGGSGGSGWYFGYPCGGSCTTYIYDYFEKPIYYAYNNNISSGDWSDYPVDANLTVVLDNIGYNSTVLTIDSAGAEIDFFSVLAYPFFSEERIKRTMSLKFKAFGIFRADITRELSDYPWYQWVTYATSIYAPNSSISTQPSYNLSDTLQFNIHISPWDDTDSSTEEIPNVQALLYSPINPYNGDPAKLIRVFDLGTVTRGGGNYSVYYTTDLYVDLIGTYTIILWMPTIGGNVFQASTSVVFGSITPSTYNDIKLTQFANFKPAGYVFDNNLNPIPNAEVRIFNNVTIVDGTTDSTGYYDLPLPADGVYNIIASKTGYIGTVQLKAFKDSETALVNLTLTIAASALSPSITFDKSSYNTSETMNITAYASQAGQITLYGPKGELKLIAPISVQATSSQFYTILPKDNAGLWQAYLTDSSGTVVSSANANIIIPVVSTPTPIPTNGTVSNCPSVVCVGITWTMEDIFTWMRIYIPKLMEITFVLYILALFGSYGNFIKRNTNDNIEASSEDGDEMSDIED